MQTVEGPPEPPSQGQNIAKESEKGDLTDASEPVNWPLFIMFSYLYILQGVISGIIGTMPYIYPQLPDYNSMALFNANLLPFSFKFILAPFLEKYSLVDYGKRKTWMVVGTAGGGAILIFTSFFTAQKYVNLIAVMFIVAQTCMSVLDIAAHAAIVKQLKSKSQASVIISYSQTVGTLLGGLILLKLTSNEFSRSVGLAHPITTPQVLLLIFGLCIFIPALIVHFRFKQTVLQSQQRGNHLSLCQVLSYYKVCLNPSSRYFRTSLILALYIQGLNFFNCLYDYQLVKAGFSKDTMNTLSNVLSVPIIILTFFFGSWTNFFRGRLNSMILAISIIVAIDLYLVIVFPLQLWAVVVTAFVTNVMQSWRFYLAAYMINDFPVHALSGMFITFVASFSNLGKQSAPHTWLCGKLGWKTCTYIGLGIQVILIVTMPLYYRWMQQGDSQVPPQIQEHYLAEQEHKQPQKASIKE